MPRPVVIPCEACGALIDVQPSGHAPKLCDLCDREAHDPPPETRRETIRRECNCLAWEAAHKIGASAWYDHGQKALTTEEQVEVRTLWDSMPGSASWMTAFMEWMNREP